MGATDLPAVAVIADAHFHDLEGDYGFAGAQIAGQRLTVRSWVETRASTRVFNESFRALRAALDDIASRGIRHVVLLGDYTDDGQRQTTAAVVHLLETYRQRHQLSFYAIPGNHDAFGPHGRHQSKGFLTEAGALVAVTSDATVAAHNPTASVLSDRMYCEGYPAGLLPMAGFGLFRRSEYLHWETPFGPSDSVTARQYTVSSQDGKTTFSLMDASYLVEPEDGLWLLMIDANVFEPRNGETDPLREETFIDSTAAGWNAVLRLKPFLIDWIADVHRRAEQLGKTVLAFSHYPVIDPFDDTTGSEAALFGDTNVVKRRPGAAVAKALIGAGMTAHFSGHLHVNGTTHRKAGSGTLSNIAVPSLVAFPPAFKIVRPGKSVPDVETVGLSVLLPDPRIVSLYRRECKTLGAAPDAAFDAKSYGAFLYAHTRALVEHRYVPKEWPLDIAEVFATADVAEICLAMTGDPADAVARLDAKATGYGLSISALRACSMMELVTDWYCLRQGGALALPFILPQRIEIYRFVAQTFGGAVPATAPVSLTSFAINFFAVLGRSLERAGNAECRQATVVATVLEEV
ncbi:metallophosphoesterase [Pararhizobium polonicum]|uniref:Metallophosphoesterase n=1 Tax=Pararhizobium polonicum TaxID=1612624 RepID=A0A1C7NWK7_9HYPH|nr:metallophosphoesterase [Pararhizobium polonicum]OBZ93417.1 metallophosphoesterase [Pararhizobium polonicum]